MKPIQVLLITMSTMLICCATSYSQAAKSFQEAKEKKGQKIITTTKVSVTYLAPVPDETTIYESVVHEDAYIMSDNKTLFEQKTFSVPLFDDPISVESTNISPTSSFKNLEVYLIYGNAETNKKKYVPLNEALKAGMVKINETSTVSKLSISNNSDQYIYINSGDIVKGGKQDRTIKYDIVVAPHAQNVDLASFCVEHNRWSQRGNEAVYSFQTSDNSLSSSNLKVAARHNGNQSEVWSEVKSYQTVTNANINTDAVYKEVIVKDKKKVQHVQNSNVQMERNSTTNGIDAVVVDVTKNESSSSLELTLENADLKKINEEYKLTIVNQLGNRQGAIGMAYFINGKLYSMDVYNNHQLFSDMFDKLLDAAIAEAISVKSTNPELPKGDIQIVKDLLKADAKVYAEESVNSITQARTSENNVNKDMWIFSTVDLEEKTWIHRNWIIK